MFGQDVPDWDHLFDTLGSLWFVVAFEFQLESKRGTANHMDDGSLRRILFVGDPYTEVSTSTVQGRIDNEEYGARRHGRWY